MQLPRAPVDSPTGSRELHETNILVFAEGNSYPFYMFLVSNRSQDDST